MVAEILSESDDEIAIKVVIKKSARFLECEEQIRDALNDAGTLATERCLENFDADGSPIVVAGRTLSAKRCKVPQKYHTPYGVVGVPRYVYQSSSGGATYCPLDHEARIIGTSTPRFAQMVSSKYGMLNSSKVQTDLLADSRIRVSRCYIQDVSSVVARIAREKEPHWEYADAEPSPAEVASIAIGIDGTCLLFCDEGNRQAMVGTIAFYDGAGERLHTTYIAAAPEYRKGAFLERMEREIEGIRARHLDAKWVGISDGASDYRPWLERFTTTQVLDFWHATEYLSAASEAMFRSGEARTTWLETACHRLKHDHGAAARLLEELRTTVDLCRSKSGRQALERAVTYFENNLSRMKYASYRKRHLPIGSGVTEAACKTLVKERMCGSGMKWKKSGADTVLCLRALHQTAGRWADFWLHISRFGVSGVKR